MSRRSFRVTLGLAAALLAACGAPDSEQPEAPAAQAEPAPPVAPEPAAAPQQAEPDAYPRGLVLSLAHFIEKDGELVPGPARLEFLYREGGAWKTLAVEDPESNVFHKAMVYDAPDGPRLLTAGGTAAILKTWRRDAAGLTPRTEWQEDFGGKWSRMRDVEVADLYGDGKLDIAVATHDQGVVAVLRPQAEGFSVVRLDEKPDTFVHEIEIGDLDGDDVLEVYATPSEPNRLDGTPQAGQVVRYVPARGEGPDVVADLGDRHAKEILVEDVDGDGRDELYVSVEGQMGGAGGRQLVEPVEIRRFEADTPPGEGVVIARLDDRLSRFLSAGDLDGDGKREMVASAFSSGVWLLRPGEDPRRPWRVEQVDADSAGFEHASLLTDLDGDGVDELYVASDKHKQLRRYRWDGERLVRDTLYTRPDDRPIFTWNLMPVPVSLIPAP